MIDKNALSHIPLLPVTACFCTGIILHTIGTPLWVSVVLLAGAGALAFYNSYFGALLCCATLGLAAAEISMPRQPDVRLCGRELFYRAEVEETKELDSSQKVIATLTHVGHRTDSLLPVAPFRGCLIITGTQIDLEPGQTIGFKATLQPVTLLTDLPDEVDPSQYLLKDGVFIQGFVRGSQVRLLPGSAAVNWKNKAFKVREKVTEAINMSSLSPFAKDFLVATLTGNTEYITGESRQNFVHAGLSHILAISGLHVGLIILLATLALWPLHVLGFNRVRSIAVILLVWIFALMTGMTASVVRAAVMATVYIVGRMLQQRTSPLNSLCLSALIILLFSPQSLFSPGFQLSFAAVASIVVFANRINPVSRKRRLAYMATSYLCVTLSAMLGTGLISAIYFHSFPVYFLLSNFIVSLLLPLILGGGVIIVILQFLAVPAAWLCQIVSGCTAILEYVTRAVAWLPGASVDNLYIPAWTVIPLVALLAWLKNALDKGGKSGIIAVTTAFLIFPAIIGSIPYTHTEPRLYLIRDKQESAIVYPSSDNCLHIVPTTPLEPQAVRQRAEFRYRDYLGRRGLDSIVIDTASPHNDKIIEYNGKLIGLFSGKSKPSADSNLNYAIICKGERGKMESVVESYHPDSIILSYDLNPKRAQRYIEECRSLGVPCHWMRHSGWSISGISD